MSNSITANISRFIGLGLIQILILNNVQLYGYINPFIYVLFVLELPFRISTTVAMLAGFLLGLTMDMFANTGGIHAATITFIAFARPLILNLLEPPEGYEDIEGPNIWEYGLGWYFTYTVVGILLHHLVLFFLEMMSFQNILFTLSRVLASSGVTVVLVVIYAYIFHRPHKRLLY